MEEEVVAELDRIQRQIRNMQRDIYEVQRIFMPLLRFNNACRAIEMMIDEEEYEEAKLRIDALDALLGPLPDLVGLRTRIDVIEMLSEENQT